MMIVTYPHHCENCNHSFARFKYNKEPIAGGAGYTIIHCCPYCGKEIPAQFNKA